MYKRHLNYALIAGTLLGSSAVAQEYAITDLGTLGGTRSEARALNDVGQVVGHSSLIVPHAHAFLWEDGEMLDLGTEGNFPNSFAYAINDAGYIVVGGASHAALWFEGEFHDVQPNEYPFANSSTVDINNAHQVIGRYDPQFEHGRAVMWEQVEGEWVMRELGTLGGTFSQARAINDDGAVVGDARTGEEHPLIDGLSVRHAFLWRQGDGMVDLGSLGGYLSFAGDVNNSSQVVGSAETGETVMFLGHELTVLHAFLWDNGEMQDLGTLGGPFSGASAINNSGHVVGKAGTSTDDIQARSVFLWRGGVMHDLNQRIPQDSGWTLTSAADINDAGQIVGQGVNPEAQEHAYLLTPSGCEPGRHRRVTICHRPPGNPDRSRTISVNARAIAAHLEHGDYCGPCN